MISCEWTDSERLWICRVLAEAIFYRPYDPNVEFWADAIIRVTTLPREYLHENRAQIENAIELAKAALDIGGETVV